MHHPVPRCANTREQPSTAEIHLLNRDKIGHNEAFQERESSTPCTSLRTVSNTVTTAQRMMETDRPADQNGIALLEATSQHQRRVNVVIKRKSAGIARTLKSHEADQSSTMPRTTRRKSNTSTRRSSEPHDDDIYEPPNFSDNNEEDEKPAAKTNEEVMNEEFKYDDKAAVFARSETETQRTNYTDMLYVIPEAETSFKMQGSYRGQRLEGIGLVKPQKSVVKLDILTITFGHAKGTMVPINEPQNKYACKILGYTMCLYMSEGNTRTPEQCCKSVLRSEVAHASQLGKLDWKDTTVDRIVKVLYKLMTGFNSNVFTQNRDIQCIVAHFMSMRTGKVPIKGGALKALSIAIDDHYIHGGTDLTPKQRHLAGKGWKIVMIHLINGHLTHHGFKPVPFSSVADQDIEMDKLRAENDLIGGAFVKDDIVTEKDEQEKVKYSTYIESYMVYYDKEKAAKEAENPKSVEAPEAAAFNGL
jgi:hypothetical protein